MADNNEESIRRETEARNASTKTTNQLADAFEDLIKRNKGVSQQLDQLNNELKTGKKRLVDVGSSLQNLREKLDDEKNAKVKAQQLARIEAMEEKAVNATRKKMYIDGAAEIVKGMGNLGVGITKSVMNSYQSNASAFGTAGDVLNTTLDSANSTAKGVFGVMNTASAGLMFLGPKGIAAGVALSALATIGTVLFDKFTDLSKFAFNVAVKELEKLTNSFAQLSSAGALFSGGLTDLRATAGMAGLMQEEFAKVVSDNSVALAQFGGSVTNGSRALAQVSKSLGTGPGSLRDGLLSLGYSVQDIVDGSAQFLALQAASGNAGRRDYANLAKETDAYLTNLRIITAFTGEDAKKAQARARDASTQLAVNTKLRQMDVNARARFENATMNMPAELVKAIQQGFVFDGNIVDQDLAAAVYNNKQASELFKFIMQDINNSNLAGEDVSRRVQDKILELGETAFASNKDLNSAVAKSTLAMNQNAGVTTAMTAIDQMFLRKRAAGEKTATESVLDAKTTQDDLTKSYREAIDVNQQLKLKIQDELTPAITMFAIATKNIITELRDNLNKLFKDNTNPTTTGVNGKPVMAPQAPVPGTPGSELKLDFKGNPISQAPTAPGGGSGTVLAKGLKIKPGAEKLGTAQDAVYAAAQQVHEMLNGDYKYFSGLKDRGISDSAVHGNGLAFDLVLNDPAKYEATLAKIKEIKQVQFAQFEKKGQKNSNGSTADADHIHAQVKAAQGAVVPATTGGTNVLVGEGGASEVIAPLKNGRLPGMDEMIDRLDQMITVLKDQRDTSEKIFQATA